MNRFSYSRVSVLRNEKVRLVEFLPNENNTLISNSFGHFTNEFVIPVYNPGAPVIPGYSVLADDKVMRNFIVGSEWLYVKIYVGETLSR